VRRSSKIALWLDAGPTVRGLHAPEGALVQIAPTVATVTNAAMIAREPTAPTVVPGHSADRIVSVRIAPLRARERAAANSPTGLAPQQTALASAVPLNAADPDAELPAKATSVPPTASSFLVALTASETTVACGASEQTALRTAMGTSVDQDVLEQAVHSDASETSAASNALVRAAQTSALDSGVLPDALEPSARLRAPALNVRPIVSRPGVRQVALVISATALGPRAHPHSRRFRRPHPRRPLLQLCHQRRLKHNPPVSRVPLYRCVLSVGLIQPRCRHKIRTCFEKTHWQQWSSDHRTHFRWHRRRHQRYVRPARRLQCQRVGAPVHCVQKIALRLDAEPTVRGMHVPEGALVQIAPTVATVTNAAMIAREPTARKFAPGHSADRIVSVRIAPLRARESAAANSPTGFAPQQTALASAVPLNAAEPTVEIPAKATSVPPAASSFLVGLAASETTVACGVSEQTALRTATGTSVDQDVLEQTVHSDALETSAASNALVRTAHRRALDSDVAPDALEPSARLRAPALNVRPIVSRLGVRQVAKVISATAWGRRAHRPSRRCRRPGPQLRCHRPKHQHLHQHWLPVSHQAHPQGYRLCRLLLQKTR
jgi:hypothetical protein